MGSVPSTKPVLCRDTVDLYFMKVVVGLDVAAGSASRICPALQWYVNVLPERERFEVRSQRVEDALKLQRINYNNNQVSRTKPFGDPHANVRVNVLSVEENKRVLKYMYRQASQWGAVTVC